jgi:hypothetical protein
MDRSSLGWYHTFLFGANGHFDARLDEMRGRRFLVLAIPAVMLLGFNVFGGPIAHAATPPAQGSSRHQTAPTPFGVGYARVCGPALPGTARCNADVATNSSGKPLSSSSPTSGYYPADLQSAYALPSSTAGNGETVALVDAYDDPSAESDLATYRSEFGLAPCTTANGCFMKVAQDGSTNYPRGNSGWGEEISLDLDMVSAICPNCHILLVEAKSSSISNLGAAVDEAASLGANAISNSYGASEFSTETSYDQYYNHPGIAVTASSGDSGYGTSYPAASPYVTAAGGTSLTRDSSVARGWDETAWSGAGSGCSTYEPQPSWQAANSNITGTGCTKRAIADVSADADPNTGVAVYDSYGQGSGWMVFGGTSVASPITASVYALGGDTANLDYSSDPYANTSQVNDITSGSNGSCGGSLLCTAGPGWDGPTGVGTPSGDFAFGAPYPSSPQGDWVNTYGSQGWVLGAWNGSSDYSYIPSATLSLVRGSRAVWTTSTTDVRALESPDQSTREATTWWDPSQIQLSLSFSAAYSGPLDLYAVDWDTTGRRESVTVTDPSGTQTATLGGSFHNGAWMSFTIAATAGQTVTIKVSYIAGSNVVLSGLFLGGTGSPAGVYPSSPQGDWVNTYGSQGWVLGAWNGSSDYSYIPSATLSLVRGSRAVWTTSTTDVRALESPDQSTREATTWWDPSQIQLSLSFSAAYSGPLDLYAVDWDTTGRRESVTVTDPSGTQTATLGGSFHNGAWMSFTIAATAGQTVTIKVSYIAGSNVVLSGLFLGGTGSPAGV